MYTPRQDGIEITADHSNPTQEFFEISENEKWLNTAEAADFLRISPKCLLNLSSNGKIPYYKFGRRNRYLENDLRKLLLANPRGGIYGN